MTGRTGACMCGAVRFSARDVPETIGVCHCEMCRKHTSGAFVSVQTIPGSVQAQGPYKSYQSSEWAERGFCEICGSTLWYETVHDGVRNLAAGLFENAAGAPLKMEFFVDECPQGYALSGDHRKMTTLETIALFAPDEGDGA